MPWGSFIHVTKGKKDVQNYYWNKMTTSLYTFQTHVGYLGILKQLDSPNGYAYRACRSG